MIVSKYVITENGQAYIRERIAKSKQEIFISVLIIIFIPLGFVALKSNFFEKTNPPLIFTAVVMFLFSGYVMVYLRRKRNRAIKSIVKELHFHDDGKLEIILFYNDVTISTTKEDIKLYEGYKDPEKMKDIFDDSTYTLENWKEGLVFYLVSIYFEDWNELAANLGAVPE